MPYSGHCGETLHVRKIKLTTGLCGNGFCHAPGDVIDWPAEEAKRLVSAGYATWATDEKGGR